jgi:hypothetical protein
MGFESRVLRFEKRKITSLRKREFRRGYPAFGGTPQTGRPT